MGCLQLQVKMGETEYTIVDHIQTNKQTNKEASLNESVFCRLHIRKQCVYNTIKMVVLRVEKKSELK